MHKKVDFLVLVSGIAGLSFAFLAYKGKVMVVTKDKVDETATKYLGKDHCV